MCLLITALVLVTLAATNAVHILNGTVTAERAEANELAGGLQRAIHLLPVVFLAPVLPLVVSDSYHSYELGILHETSLLPLVLMTENSSLWENKFSGLFPTPSVFIFLGVGCSRKVTTTSIREGLYATLQKLKSTSLWSPNAWILLHLRKYSAANAAGIHRALVRSGVLQALGLSTELNPTLPGRSLPSTSDIPSIVSNTGLDHVFCSFPNHTNTKSPTNFECDDFSSSPNPFPLRNSKSRISTYIVTFTVFNLSHRPARLSRQVNFRDIHHLQKRPNISENPIVISVYCNLKHYEKLCLDGMNPWKYSPFERIMKILIEKLRFRALCWTKVGSLAGYRMQNGTYTGLVAKLVSGTTDILAVNVPVSVDWHLVADPFYPHTNTYVCFYVRRPQVLPFVQSLLSSYSTYVAWLILCSLIFICSTMICSGVSVGDSVFRTYATFMTGMFRTRGHPVALALSVMTALFSVLSLNGLQSNAASYLSVPRHEPYLKTFDDIDNNVNEVVGRPSVEELFTLSENSALNRIGRKLYYTEDTDIWFDYAVRASHDSKVSLVLEDDIAPYLIWHKSFVKDGHLLFTNVDECLVTTSPFYFLAKRNSPYLQTLNDMIQLTVQAGLSNYVVQISPETRKVFGLSLWTNGPVSLNPYSLRFFHIQETFYLLFVGLILSFVVLLMELFISIICGKVLKKKDKSKSMLRKRRFIQRLRGEKHIEYLTNVDH